MRIISKFQDYYDGVGAYSGDKTPLYLRHTREFTEKELKDQDFNLESLARPLVPKKRFIWSRRRRHTSNLEVKTTNIAFCGRSYTLWTIENAQYYDVRDFFAAVDAGISTDKQQYLNHIVKKRVREDHELYVTAMRKEKRVVNQIWNEVDSYAFSEEGFEAWIDRTDNDVQDHVFLSTGVPVLMWQDRKLILNPCLKDLGFASVVDPYTAYQEIDMYLGNQLAQQQDPVPERTQELIRDSKGFDNHSFKTGSPGKKARRRKK